MNLFLAQFQKVAREDSLDEVSWIKFVADLREQAKVAEIAQLAGTPSLKGSIIGSIVRKQAVGLGMVGDFLDVRSLVSFQSVALGMAPKVLALESKRGNESLDYNASYYASAPAAPERLRLHYTIVGDGTPLIMRTLDFNELVVSRYARKDKSCDLIEIAKQYGHAHLLNDWWERLTPPDFRVSPYAYNLTFTDSAGFSVLSHAAYFSRSDLIPLLFTAGADPQDRNALCAAVFAKEHSLVKLFIKKGAKVNQKNRNDATPLSVACEHNLPEITATLLEAKADPNIQSNRNNETPLLWAAWSSLGSSACINMLLDAKADYKAVNKFDETALHWLIERDDLSGLQSLLAKYVEDKSVEPDQNPLLIGPNGNTPLHLALIQQKEKFANCVLQAAVDNIYVMRKVLLHTNNKHQSTLVLAAAFPTLSMLKVILDNAMRYQVIFAAADICTILDTAKNDAAILRLLEQVVSDPELKNQIAKLRDDATTKYCNQLVDDLTGEGDPTIEKALGFEELKFEPARPR